MLSKNSFIGPAASAGLAVNTNMSLLPGLSLMNLANSNKGPLAPFITLLNSEKSHSAPLASSSPALFANSVAVKDPFFPSGISYNTLLLVVANVSSKSNTLIFLTGDLRFLAIDNALSILLKFSKDSSLDTFLENLSILGVFSLFTKVAFVITSANLTYSLIKPLASLLVTVFDPSSKPASLNITDSIILFCSNTTFLFCSNFLGTTTLYSSALVSLPLYILFGFKPTYSFLAFLYVLKYLKSELGTLSQSSFLPDSTALLSCFINTG